MDDSKSDKLDKKSETEVEVKLRIPDAACFAALRDMLLPCFRRAHEQENCFFDGASQELSSRHVVLRLRFYDVDRKAVMTMKGKQILQGGIGSALEVEEEIDVKLARQYLEDPSSMLTSEISVIKKLKETVGEIPGGLVSLGSFFNLRREYIWRGHVLELDQTSFPWGTLYEIEAETPKPEELKQELEAVLAQHDIPYSYSVKSKFANFIEKTLV